MESSTGAFFDEILMPRTPSDRAEVNTSIVCVVGGCGYVCVYVCVGEYEDIFVYTYIVCVCACVHLYHAYSHIYSHTLHVHINPHILIRCGFA